MAGQNYKIFYSNWVKSAKRSARMNPTDSIYDYYADIYKIDFKKV